MCGIYWCLTSMELMDQTAKLNRDEIIEFVRSNQIADSGGFAASHQHDAHLLHTLSAVQVYGGFTFNHITLIVVRSHFSG